MSRTHLPSATPPRLSRLSVAATIISMLVLVLAVPAASTGEPPSGQAASALWRDVAGAPLPFQEHGELLAFLREAKIVANEKIPIGITGPRRLTLELGGVNVSAAFRNVDEAHSRIRLPDGSYFQKLRDFCGYEVAAYEISRMLDMHTVPPAVHRTVGRDAGTVQIWVEDTMMEEERVEQGLRSPNPQRWGQQVQEMLIFDQLVGNVDRNPGNMLIDADWTVWLIDHTRAFQQGDELKNVARLRMVRRSFWEQLQALDKDTVAEMTKVILESRHINDMFERRDQLVAHLQGLIDQRGEGAVIYE